MDTKKLRQKILDLAIHGKLVPQDPNDEPASLLLERIRVKKERLIKEGKTKRSKKADSDDETEAPFEIPESWEWTILGEISNYGITTNVDVKDIPQNAWVLELEDLERDSATIIKRITKGEREIKGVRHSFKKGDVLYSKLRTYLNKVLIAPEDGYCTTEIIPISFYPSVQSTYLNHVLRSKYFLDYTIQCGYGVKMPRLSTIDACKGQVPLPPFCEQKRIVAAIEQWFSLIDILENEKSDLQASIQQAKSKILDLAIHGKLVPQDPNDEPAIELLKRINPEFEGLLTKNRGNVPDGWIYATISDCFVEIINGYAFQSSKYTSDGIRVIRITNVQDGFIEDSAPKFYPLSYRQEIEKYKLNANDLLMSLTGNVGRVGFLPEQMLPAALNQRVCCIRPNKEVLSKTFLYYLFQTDTFKKDCIASGKGVAQLNISTEWLKDYSIQVPPYQEQLRIVAKIEELFAILDSIKESLE